MIFRCLLKNQELLSKIRGYLKRDMSRTRKWVRDKEFVRDDFKKEVNPNAKICITPELFCEELQISRNVI